MIKAETDRSDNRFEPGAEDGVSSSRVAFSFDWPLATQAEKWLREILGQFLERNSFAKLLSDQMVSDTATDFFEWIDHFTLSAEHKPHLRDAGFLRETPCDTPTGQIVYELPRATLPRVLLTRGQHKDSIAVALRPESLPDFIATHNLSCRIEGEAFSRYRRAVVAREDATSLDAVERHAYRGFVNAPLDATEVQAIVRARELWHTRPRRFHTDEEGFSVANQTLNHVLSLVDRDRACQYFFENERSYWESRNYAARVQKHRQDQLGLGWGNHDHHTFRCSRRHFVDLVEFLLKLGFSKRERFYAGAEAGWGAQILEQSTAGVVVFADVDLIPEETEIDFSSIRLAPAPRLGTVGLWVALHGESFLEAGMHHLEARFDFDRLQAQLKQQGINTMEPFSNFEFLRQAFTEGERWLVRHERLQSLCSSGLITHEQMDRFGTQGAIGSHLENLQRHGGFKGFNQKSVSVVIAATDPRHLQFANARGS